MRLLAIAVGSLVVLTAFLFFVNIWGLSQAHTTFETRFFSKQSGELTVAIPWEQSYVDEKAEFVLWADVYQNSSGELLLKPWVERDKLSKELEQIASPTRPKLADKLKEINAQKDFRWILNITDNKSDIHQKVADAASVISEDLVMIQSDHNIVLTSIKSLKPMWLYGTGIPDILRFRTFQSMHILPATPFKGDVFFFTPEQLHKKQVTEEILAELKRRSRKIMLGPISNAEELNTAQSLGVDGVLINDPVWYLRSRQPPID